MKKNKSNKELDELFERTKPNIKRISETHTIEDSFEVLEKYLDEAWQIIIKNDK